MAAYQRYRQLRSIEVATSIGWLHAQILLTEGRNMLCDTTATTSWATLMRVSCAYVHHSSHHNDATETAVISGTTSTLPRGDSPEVAVPRNLYICEGENQ